MLIWILTPALERVNGIENFSSFIVSKHYKTPSSFELHLPCSKENLQLVQERQLCLGQILLKSGENEGYLIEELTINYEAFGGEIILKGRDLRAYLERRIVMAEQIQNDVPRQLVQNWLEENVITPKDAKRKMSQVRIGSLPTISNRLQVELKYQNLLELIASVCDLIDFGFKILVDIDRKQLIFEMYQGKDRTTTQSENVQAIFSQEFENMLAQKVVFNENDLKNAAILQYERDEKSYVLEMNDGQNDYLRREVFVDAKQIGKGTEDEPVSENEQKELVKQKGQEELLKYSLIETMEADVFASGHLRYQEDYDLGDKVTIISSELGLQLETRIETVEEVYEENGLEIKLTFGNNVPTLVEKIKRKVK